MAVGDLGEHRSSFVAIGWQHLDVQNEHLQRPRSRGLRGTRGGLAVRPHTHRTEKHRAHLPAYNALLASSCARGGFDWISGKISSVKRLSSTGTGFPGQWWNHHFRRFPLKDVKMWDLGTWFSVDLGALS